MSLLHIRQSLLFAGVGLCFLPALVHAQVCPSAASSATSASIGSSSSGQNSVSGPGFLTQLGNLQNMMGMQRNLQMRQQRPVRITPGERQLQQQMLLAEIGRQQEAVAQLSETDQAEEEQSPHKAAISNDENQVDLSKMSRLERKKHAIRERRRLRELARVAKN